jgi:hypothetical protein
LEKKSYGEKDYAKLKEARVKKGCEIDTSAFSVSLVGFS